MKRRGFTLVELLITVMIIGIMAGLVLVAMFGATEAAKRHKTEALIARIDAVIQGKWDSYQTRRVPVDFTNAPAGVAPRARIDALHDLMRMELPDRWSDVSDTPPNWTYGSFSFTLPRPAASQVYKRRWDAAQIGMPGKPTLAEAQEYQGAECLYLILQATAQEEGDDVSVILRPDNIGDVDKDGFPEIIDAWGTPIRFLRWAPGFLSERAVVAVSKIGGTPPGAGSDPHRLEFYIEGGNLPQSGGDNTTQSAASIIGGAIIARHADGGWDYANAAQISGYIYDPDNTTTPPTPRARVVCTTPSSVGNPGSVGFSNTTVFLTAPDPLDYQGVYRKDLNTSNLVPPFAQAGPTFAMHPLIYSAGPDKSYGVVGDTSPALSYAGNNVNPFFKPTSGDPMGFQKQLTTERGDWKDNIHNQTLGRR